MTYQEKTLTCQDCGRSFVFTAEEQQFHAEKGYANVPKRCPNCRRTRRQDRGSDTGGFGGTRMQMYPATCAQCGKETEVPFEPRGDRPVYCKECFDKLSSKRSY